MHLLSVAMLLVFGFLIVNLWQIQVLRASEFSSSLDRQSIRRVRLPGIRGRIFDRKGKCLAENRPHYCLAIYTEELRQRGRWSRTVDKVDEVVDELALVLGLPRQVTREDIRLHVQRRLPLPFLVWRDLDDRALARWAEYDRVFAGVDVYVEPERVYPFGLSASHVIGYVGRADAVDTDENPYHYYLPEMEGKGGVEKTADARLRGRAGGRLIRVDASGFKYEEKGDREPVPGTDVTLALDMDIQAMAENVLNNRPGAVVVMDPRNGDVLALASAPAFDVRALGSQTAWQALLENPGRPLINRAIAGQYPPGSIFKPMVALAALVSGRATVATEVSCPGFITVGNQTFRCWSRRGHGDLAMRKALEQSCNPYFIDIALRMEYKRLYHMAASTGFGLPTGIELDGEAPGLLPDDEWKRQARRDAWRPGDTANVSIGQGALLVTPLQMAMFTCALANGGKIYRPRLLRDMQRPEGDFIKRMAWTPAQLDVVRSGMHDVVHAEQGTGKRVRIDGVEMAGKTGTAQYGDGLKHAWMILFAPYESPRYAVVMMMENAVSGGISVAPELRELMQMLLVHDGTLVAPPPIPEEMNLDVIEGEADAG
jgi:penicillin-binding protein 2